MAQNDKKRYYWLKLQTNFFSGARIRKMRRLPDGDTLCVVYLKLLLASLETEGLFPYEGLEPTLEAEVALKLDEPEETVVRLLTVLAENRMIEAGEGGLFLFEVGTLVGSETEAAARRRKWQENTLAAKEEALFSSPEAGENFTPPSPDLHPEIEGESKKEKNSDAVPQIEGEPYPAAPDAPADEISTAPEPTDPSKQALSPPANGKPTGFRTVSSMEDLRNFVGMLRVSHLGGEAPPRKDTFSDFSVSPFSKMPKPYGAPDIPTVEEVQAYQQELQTKTTAEAFFDYYASIGWKIGNKPISDWKAAFRTFDRRQREFEQNARGKYAKKPHHDDSYDFF